MTRASKAGGPGPGVFFRSLAGYQRSWLRADLLAGLTVWAVLVPEALAYATIAGVSPVIGLYAAPGALLLYAALGSSRHLVTGPMAATAALSAAIIGDVATGGSDQFLAGTIALALTVGFLALLAGLLRLGFLASFISEPVLKGFIVGLALMIIVGQLPKLFGIEGSDGDFFESLWAFLTHLDQTNVPTLIVGLISLGIVVGLKEFLPVIPGSLVAVGFGIGVVALLGLDEDGVAIVGPIQSGLPRLGLPAVAASDYMQLVPAAVGVALIGFAEGLGAAKTYASKFHYQIDADRELLGLGAANLAAGFTGGMVVNGSLSKTAVNGGAGAKTQVSGLVVAVLVLVTLLFLTGLFADLPEATLAAIVIAALVELIDVRSLVGYYRVFTGRLGRIYGTAAREDFIAAVAALFGVLIFDTLPGLFIGIVVSIVLLVYRSSRPNVAVLGLVPGTATQYADVGRHPENVQPTGIVVLRPESLLFFANADRIRLAIQAHVDAPATRAVVLDLETVSEVDITAARVLIETAADLAAAGKELVLAHDIGQVRDVLRATGAADLRVYGTVAQAVAALTTEAGPAPVSGFGAMPPLRAPRGTRDLLPPETALWTRLERLAADLSARYGYRRIETPLFESTAVFERGVGEVTDIVEKELFRLAPRTDESDALALRPEPTAGIVRAYIQHGMQTWPQPVKVSQVGPMFRYDRPQAGRYRQFWQFDIEAIGDPGPAIDAEIIELGVRFYRDAGLSDVEVLVNSIGDPACRPAYLALLTDYYRGHRGALPKTELDRLERNVLRLLDSKDPAMAAINRDAPRVTDHLCADCSDHFASVKAHLDGLGVPYRLEPSLVRGLDYYTRTAFEFYLPGRDGQQQALGGGGRYDGLVELLGGRPTPGIGFGIGLDRVVIVLLERGSAEPDPAIVAVVVGADPAATAARLRVATDLRAAGLAARADLTHRRLGKQLEAAAKEHAHFAIIVGDELGAGEVQLRDLPAGTQKVVPLADLAAEVARAHGAHKHGVRED